MSPLCVAPPRAISSLSSIPSFPSSPPSIVSPRRSEGHVHISSFFIHCDPSLQIGFRARRSPGGVLIDGATVGPGLTTTVLHSADSVVHRWIYLLARNLTKGEQIQKDVIIVFAPKKNPQLFKVQT